jgi:hypothetical protein
VSPHQGLLVEFEPPNALDFNLLQGCCPGGMNTEGEVRVGIKVESKFEISCSERVARKYHGTVVWRGGFCITRSETPRGLWLGHHLTRPCALRSQEPMSAAQDGLIYAIGWAHVLLAPYAKVEESFNLHATHDVLMYGVGPPALHNVRV